MKYDMTLKLFGHICEKTISKDVTDKNVRKAIKDEYKAIVERASDIGKGNMLISSYALAAYFIAMVRKTELTPEECFRILNRELRHNRLLKMGLGTPKEYFSEKKMEKRRKWSEETKKCKYKNDWIVDVLEKTDDYQFGLNYTKCGVCDLCRDEGCFELAKYLCRLDFMIVEIIGIKLKRTMTLADGDPMCDFRFLSL